MQETHGKMLKEFRVGLESSEEIRKLREDVMAWSQGFPMPGIAAL